MVLTEACMYALLRLLGGFSCFFSPISLFLLVGLGQHYLYRSAWDLAATIMYLYQYSGESIYTCVNAP
jgi:hypothetical protein